MTFLHLDPRALSLRAASGRSRVADRCLRMAGAGAIDVIEPYERRRQRRSSANLRDRSPASPTTNPRPRSSASTCSNDHGQFGTDSDTDVGGSEDMTGR